MEYRTVHLAKPMKGEDIGLFKAEVPFKENMTIYDTIDRFYENFFSRKKLDLKRARVKKRTPLKVLINLHNKSGMRSIIQIESMLKSIKSGSQVVHSNGMPNTKVVQTKRGEWVIFDGHHTTLAYMIAGRKYLHEIPHMIVEDEDTGTVEDREIHAFFGWHAPELKEKDWREYVINWQAQKENQVQKRKINNMGELFDTIKSRF